MDDILGDILRRAVAPTAQPTEQTPAAPPPTAAPDRDILDEIAKTHLQPDVLGEIAKSAGIPQETPTQEPAPPPQTEEGGDGFWSTMGQAAQKGIGEGWQATKTLAAATGRKLEGQDFFVDQPSPPPEVADEATKVLNEPWSADNLFSPKKWAATITRGATASWPELAAATVGGLVAGPIGAAGGFALGTGLESLMPNYQAARAQGLDHDAAISQSLKASGVDAGAAALMGLAPEAKILDAVKRPVTDAMVKMGLVQPALGVGGLYAHAAVTGKDVSPDDVMNTAVGAAGLGVGLTAVHAGVAGFGAGKRSLNTPATPEGTQAAFDTATAGRSDPPPAETSPVVVHRTLQEGETLHSEAPTAEGVAPTFFSRVQQVVDEKGPEKASPSQWLATIRNAPGVKGEEIESLNLPQWLADRQGNVSKADLLAHIEENQVRIEESLAEDKGLPNKSWTLVEGTKTAYGEYRLPGPINRYGELKFYFTDPKEEGVGYTAPHFGDRGENLLAHARYTDRIDRDGARTLFIEEIQSDWHQKGREYGYLKKVDPALEAQAVPIENKVQKYFQLGPRDTPPNGWAEVAEREGIVSREELNTWAEYQKALRAELFGAPEAPFKTSWPDLAFKRLMRYAADEGFQRIAWTNGEQQIARYPGLDERQKLGMRQFYDGIDKSKDSLPAIADRWAKRLGMERGETRLVQHRVAIDKIRSDRVRYIEVSPAAASRIRMGLPLFSEVRGVLVSPLAERYSGIRVATERVTSVLSELSSSMGIEGAIRVDWEEKPIPLGNGATGYGEVSRDSSGYRIRISVTAHRNFQEIYATLAHEFGHIVMFDKLRKAPDAQVERLLGAYRRFLDERGGDETFGRLLLRRDNAVSALRTMDSPNPTFETSVLSMTPERQRYWSGFEEWFAEQVAKWATTSAKPMSILDRFFGTLGKQVRAAVAAFRERIGIPYAGHAALEMKQWLDSLMTSSQPFMADHVAASQFKTMQASQRSFERDGTPEVQAVPQGLGTQSTRDALARIMTSEMPPAAAADAAHVDRMNKAYEWLTSLPQLAEVNPGIKPLQYYVEGIGLFNAKIRQEMEKPLATLTAWRRLKGKQSDAVAGLIDDWANMRYRTADEVTNKIRRMPTKDEFERMVSDNKVSDAGLEVFKKSVRDLDSRLNDLSRILKQRAMGISDDATRNTKLASVDRMVADLRAAPYFPFLRRGDYTVTVYGADGSVKHFERFETQRQQKAGEARISSLTGAGDRVLSGFMAKDVEPLVGLPPAMLDLLHDTLQLSDTQKIALQQLKFDHSPEQSFLHRLSQKKFTPGYSQDFLRSYANYWFHSSRYFARAEYSDRLRGWIQETRALRYTRNNATKIDQIANFMGKHFDYVMSPKNDFAALRGLIFNLRLGFSPTTATLYLTQTPLGTYPWLASAFGDVKSLAAIGRASARLSNYYKAADFSAFTGPKLKGLREAMRQGVLDGGAAPELAAISEGRNLSGGFGRGAATRAWTKYQEYAGTLLHLADTWNRRVAFDAGWQLAIDNPDAKYILRARERNPQEYQRLLSEGWSTQEASAFVVGKHTVESTHFVYQRSHRPQLMWGKSSALLMFKFWQQNMLFTLWNYPSVAARSLIVMAAMGGAMGLPFAQDFNGILKAIGWRLFGKDWDLDRETRQFVSDHFGPGGKELADSLLHGLARKGMGIPAVLEALGHHVGANIPFPSVDRSGAIGLGDVLPVNPGDVLGPQRDLNSTIARASQSAAGAAFGFGFDVYKLLSDSQLSWTDAKRWEQVAPHWMANLSKAYRWYSEGRERDRGGNTVVRFDPNDTTEMMEIIARSLGYNPTRLGQQYDLKTAEREVETYWDLRHSGLLRQAWEAKRSGDKDEYQRVIAAVRSFNSQLPEMAKSKAITADQLRQFFETKARAAAEIEQGIPTSKKNAPIERAMQKIYPDAKTVGRQRVLQNPQ